MKPILSTLLALVSVLALSAPAAAKSRADEPVLVLATGPMRVVSEERQQLRERLTRVDFLLADALRKARRPEAREQLQDARDALTSARRMLGFAPSNARGVAFERDEARPDDAHIDALYGQRLVVADVDAVRRELSLSERALAGLDDERHFTGAHALIAEARQELSAAQQTLAWFVGGTPPPAPSSSQHDPSQPWPMGDQAFEALLSNMSREAWARDRLTILETAARTQWFVVSQVLRTLERFDFSQQRLQAVRLVEARILDPQNDYQLYTAFPSSADKEELGRILNHAQAASLPQPIAARELERLVQMIRSAPTAEAVFALLSREAPSHWFQVSQVASIIRELPTPDSRMRALTILRPRVLDPQSWRGLEAFFPNDAYKRQVAEMFR
jgi:hypothetical protein